jgi:hypothetical protein
MRPTCKTCFRLTRASNRRASASQFRRRAVPAACRADLIAQGVASVYPLYPLIDVKLTCGRPRVSCCGEGGSKALVDMVERDDLRAHRSSVEQSEH